MCSRSQHIVRRKISCHVWRAGVESTFRSGMGSGKLSPLLSAQIPSLPRRPQRDLAKCGRIGQHVGILLGK